MLKKLLICALLFFISGFPLFAQTGNLRFEHLTVDDGLSQNSVYGIVKDKYGFMWFGTWEGICRFDGYKITVFRADESNPNALINNRVNLIFKDSVQDIWVATSDYSVICKYNYDSENFTRVPEKEVKRYILDSLKRAFVYYRRHAKNNLYSWSVAVQGLKQINLRNHSEYTYLTDASFRWSLNDNIVTDIYFDDNDILWVGTRNGGVNKADTRSKPFFSYSVFRNSNPMVDNVIRAICMDRSGNLWIGTENKGVLKIDRRNNTIRYYLNQRGNGNSLVNNEIRQIYCDRYGTLWIGTKGGLDRLDPRTERFHHYTETSQKTIPNNWVFWIMEDHAGYLWIGTFNGIAKYNRGDDSFLAYDPGKTLKSKNVRVIMEDRNKKLWIATEGGGITRLSRDSSAGFKEKLTPVHYQYSATNPNSLINNQVLAMMEDENGYIWIGTNSGLCRFDQNKGEFTRLSVKNGLPDDLIMGILSDSHGHIWISHKKGITRIDSKTLALRNFDSHDGLQGNEFSQNAYYRDRATGEMFFGGINGLNSFFPDKIKDNPFYPKVVFTGLQVSNNPVEINQPINGRIILFKSLVVTKEITLPYLEKNFSVEFAALHFSNPRGNKYRYKLEGYDSQWISCDASNRKASYSGLHAGTYHLKVFASNCDGLWSTSPAVLKITILPPWWLTWWAYLSYLIIISLIFYFSLQYIRSKIQFRQQLLIERLKTEKEKEVAQLKMQFFTNISHEFRTPLSLIIDPLEKLISDKISPGKAQTYYGLMYKNAQRLLDLINQLLDFRKIESGNMQLKLSREDIVAFLKNITEAFEFHASQRHIRFSFHSEFQIFHMAFDSRKLDKIMYNLVSNAFKYTADQGEISVELSLSKTAPGISGVGEYIIIGVKDNGTGIPPESVKKIFDPFYQVEPDENKKGTGIGLALTRELVELHKGTIHVESEPGKGSHFRVFLPVIDVVEADPKGKEPIRESLKVEFLDDIRLNEEHELSSGEVRDKGLRPLIFIVDDHPDIRNYMKSNLSEEYQVELSENGEEGLAKAIELIPDLVISDVMMPGMNGLELCRKLKTHQNTSHIPVILLTARQSDECRIESYETGADAFITKPFSTTILLSRIKNLLDSRQKLREVFSRGTSFELKKISINVTDEAFMNRIMKLIDENLSESEFDTDKLASSLKMSRSQLYRKIKALTNQTVHDFVMTYRLNKAAELLLQGDLSISEVAYQVGFSLPTNFTRSFVKQFGETPSKYVDSFRKSN